MLSVPAGLDVGRWFPPWRPSLHGGLQNPFQGLGKLHVLLQRAGKFASARPDHGGRRRIPRDAGEARAQQIDVVDVLDRDTTVSVHEAPIGPELSDHLGRPDQASAAQKDLARHDRRMKHDRKVLFEAAYRHAPAQELGHPPMREKGNLQDAVDQPEPPRPRTEAAFDLRLAMRERDQPDVQPRLLEAVQGVKQRERPLAVPELAVDAEIGPARLELSPQQIAEIGIRRRIGPQCREIEGGAVRTEQVFRHGKSAAIGDATGIDPALPRALGHRSAGDDDLGGSQYMVVERLELRMMPEVAGIAARHARHMRHACDFRGEMPGHAIRLQVMGQRSRRKGARHARGRRCRRAWL